MQILEDEDERTLLGERLEQPPPGGVRLGAPVAAGAVGGAEPDERAHVAADPAALGRVRDEVIEQRRELPLGRVGLVRLEDSRLRLHDLAERPVAQPLPVRERAPLPPPDQLLVAVDDLEHLRDEPALADARDADERDELRRELAPRALQRVHERSQLPLTADERRAQAIGDVVAEACARRDGLPDRDRLGLALGLDGLRLAVLDDIPRRPIRGVSDEDAVDRRGRLHPRRGVDDVAGDHRLALGRPRAEGDERLARVHGRAKVEVVDRVANGERRANGALRVVLVGGRSAEHGHDRVADELLDGAAVPLDLVAQARVVGRQRRAHVLGVEPLGAAREADEVGEEDGDDLPLLPRGLGGERRPAAAAEAEALGILLSALGADDHGHTVRRATALRRESYAAWSGAGAAAGVPTGASSSGRMGAPVSRQSWQRSDAKRSSAGARAPPQARQMLFGRASFVTRSRMAARSDGMTGIANEIPSRVR